MAEHREELVLAPIADLEILRARPLSLVEPGVLDGQRHLVRGHPQQRLVVRGVAAGGGVEGVDVAGEASGRAEPIATLHRQRGHHVAAGQGPARPSDDTLERRLFQLDGQRDRADRVGQSRQQRVEHGLHAEVRGQPVDRPVDAL